MQHSSMVDWRGRHRHRPVIVCRPIQPSDLEVLEKIHTYLFPIRYEPEFFSNVVNGRDIVSWGVVDRSRRDGGNDELIGFVTARIVPAKDSEIEDLLRFDTTKSDPKLVYILTLGVVDSYRNLGIEILLPHLAKESGVTVVVMAVGHHNGILENGVPHPQRGRVKYIQGRVWFFRSGVCGEHCGSCDDVRLGNFVKQVVGEDDVAGAFGFGGSILTKGQTCILINLERPTPPPSCGVPIKARAMLCIVLPQKELITHEP